MVHHHGDPRSNVLGEQPYDETEYPNVPFNPPHLPPDVGNVENYIPYRGQEQHGVQLTRNAHTGYLPYAAEQAAEERAIDPTVTPRDLSNVPPIRVKVVDAPDLLYRRLGRAANFVLGNDSQFHAVAQPNRLRKRITVTATAGATATKVYLSPDIDAQIYTALCVTVPVNTTVTILESQFTEGVYVLVDQNATNVSVWQEYTQSDGDSLL